MQRSSAAFIAAVCVVLLAGQAQAARDLRAPGTSFATRALKQVGDAFTRWGSNGYVDDGARSYGTVYSQISGTAEPGYGNYGYYGNPAAAGYFGGMYPSQADLALYRMNPSAGSLANRASIRTTRYNSRYPYDI